MFYIFFLFSVHFLSIKELTLLVFECSMFGFLDKRVIFISFRVFFVCFFIYRNDLCLIRFIKNMGDYLMYEYVGIYIMYNPVLSYYTRGTTITYW